MELFAQITEVVDASGRLSEGGIVVILLAFIITMIFGVGITIRYVMKRLFDEDRGLVTQLVNKIIESADQLIKSTRENVVATKKIESHVVRMDASMTSSMKDLEHFKRVWKRAVSVLKNITKHFGIESLVEEDIARINDIFEQWESNLKGK